MEQNITLCNFPVIKQKKFDLGLGIPKSKFLGFREGYSMASGRRVRKRVGWNSLFRSIPGVYWSVYDCTRCVLNPLACSQT